MLNDDIINKTIKKNFDPLILQTNTFPLKYHFQSFNLKISSLKNNELLFICSNNTNFYASAIHQLELKNFNSKFVELKDINVLYSHIIKTIKENILSIKVFANLNLILLCLSDINSNDTIFQFYLTKLSSETIDTDIIKMIFRKKADKEAENEDYLKIINSLTNYLDSFNKMYETKLSGNERFIDISFNEYNKSVNKPIKKINDNGFALFCKNKFPNLAELWIKCNELNEEN